jgi:maltose alpha-D-glucosyltransferase/alpha-amylase
MHLALGSEADRAELAPEPYTTLYQRSLYQAMRGSAGRVLRQLRRQMPRLPEESRPEVAEVLGNQDKIFASYGRLLSRKITAWKIRVHGDFHLGQVLNTGKDFVIIDFEGEPRRALGERVLKRSPLVDVAGMVRSFDYAAAAALRRQTAADAVRLEGWVRAWVETICAHFLESYFSVAQPATFLPADPADVGLLLEIFVLDKAVYEVGYELSYRPDFLPIPVRAVQRLLGDGELTKRFSDPQP